MSESFVFRLFSVECDREEKFKEKEPDEHLVINSDMEINVMQTNNERKITKWMKNYLTALLSHLKKTRRKRYDKRIVAVKFSSHNNLTWTQMSNKHSEKKTDGRKRKDEMKVFFYFTKKSFSNFVA